MLLPTPPQERDQGFKMARGGATISELLPARPEVLAQVVILGDGLWVRVPPRIHVICRSERRYESRSCVNVVCWKSFRVLLVLLFTAFALVRNHRCRFTVRELSLVAQHTGGHLGVLMDFNDEVFDGLLHRIVILEPRWRENALTCLY